jgi:O-methyltransferase involved in polyketide biosynthesis
VSDTANPLTTGISRTCIYTATGRAIGARDPDASVRNPDYLAEKLLGDPSSFNISHSSIRAVGLSYDEAMKDVDVVSTVRMMMVRTRFIDEALERAVAEGTQVGAQALAEGMARMAQRAREAGTASPESHRPTSNHSQTPTPKSE